MKLDLLRDRFGAKYTSNEEITYFLESLALRVLGEPHWTENHEQMFRAQLQVNMNKMDPDRLVNVLNDLQECILAGCPRDEAKVSTRKSDAEQALDALLDSGGIAIDPAKEGARDHAIREMMRLQCCTPYWLAEDQERFEKMLEECTVPASSVIALHKRVAFGESGTNSNDQTHGADGREADGQIDERSIYTNDTARSANVEGVRDGIVWGHKRQLPGGFAGRVGARISEGDAAAAKEYVQQLEQMDLSHVVSKIDTGNNCKRRRKRGKKGKKSRRQRAKAKSVASFADGAAQLPPIKRSASVPPRILARNSDAKGTRSGTAADKLDSKITEIEHALLARNQAKRQQRREQRRVQRAAAEHQQQRELQRIATDRGNSRRQKPSAVPALPAVRDHVVRISQLPSAAIIGLTV
jgi:hypothetical protein